jgi:serine-type D-Ala-D-Ala carboxypeptidase/endopeptidase (penicillin-binding protein 4)
MFVRIIIVFLSLCPAFLFSQNKSKLKDAIQTLNADEAMKHAVWSVCVMPVKKDTILAEYNSTISLTPASTMKVATTGAALSLLGKDFRFETRIQYDGTYDSVSGVIHGNLYITGGGDPTLESEYFKKPDDTLTVVQRWAALLKTKGIKKITGAVIGDAGIFDYNMTPSEWVWGDIGNYYGAGACGLSYHDNKYTLYFKSGSNGSKTTITGVKPDIKDLQFVNMVTSAGSDDNAYIYGAPYSYYRIIQGTIPAGKTNYEVDGAIPDPALFCVGELTSALNRAGINVAKKFTTVRELKESIAITKNDKHTLFTNFSPPLDSIIHFTNLRSINLYAESILKYLSYKKSDLGTESEGTKIVTDYWKGRGVDVSGFFMTDGCGLARANVITTHTQTLILRLMANDKNYKVFYNSLPVAGKSGSLGGMCVGTFAENNLHAKSGYMNRARGYAGYVKNKKGETLCFSLLANNYDCTPTEMKKKLEKIMVALTE